MVEASNGGDSAAGDDWVCDNCGLSVPASLSRCKCYHWRDHPMTKKKKKLRSEQAKNIGASTTTSTSDSTTNGWTLMDDIEVSRIGGRFGLSLQPDPVSARVLVSRCSSERTTGVQKGDVIVSVNGQTALWFDPYKMTPVKGVGVKRVAEMIRSIEDGRSLRLAILRRTGAGNVAGEAQTPPDDSLSPRKRSPSPMAGTGAGKKSRKSAEMENSETSDDVRCWDGVGHFLNRIDLAAATASTKTKLNTAVAAASERAAALQDKERREVVGDVLRAYEECFALANTILVQQQKDIDEAVSSIKASTLKEERKANAYRNFLDGVEKDEVVSKRRLQLEQAIEEHKAAESNYRTLLATRSASRDEAIGEKLEMLDSIIQEKKEAKERYLALVGSFQRKEMMLSVIAERKRALDHALSQSRAEATCKVAKKPESGDGKKMGTK